jgi:hypothetical protein
MSSFFNSLLSAINQGSGAYNDEQDFQQMMMKDKVGLDSARANTNLANQRFDFNELNMTQLLELAKINNANATTQGEGFTLDNIEQQRMLDWAQSYYDNPLTTQAAKNNYQGLIGSGTGYSPTNQAKLDNNNTMVAIRTSVEYQGQQYSGDKLETLQNAIKALTATSSSSSPANSQFKSFTKEDGSPVIGSFDPNTGVFTEDTRGITPMGMMNTINTAIDERYPDADREFDNDANYAAFEQKASEIYQGFIAKGMDMYAAEQATKQVMLSMLSEDDDLQFGFLSDRELIYTPQDGQQQSTGLPTIKSDEDYLKLKSGDQFIDPNGQVRTKP